MRSTLDNLNFKLHSFEIHGIPVDVYDLSTSKAATVVAAELSKDSYGIEDIPFAERDCVLDVGGHIGLFSIYLGKRFPFLQIYAYEPFFLNQNLFQENISLNRVTNVCLRKKAVSGDGRLLNFKCSNINTGSATCQSHTLNEIQETDIPSTTLDNIFEDNSISNCKLLKIDCEGSEHEILLNSNQLSRVSFLSGEFHINAQLESSGYSLERLYRYSQRWIDKSKLRITYCRMSE